MKISHQSPKIIDRQGNYAQSLLRASLSEPHIDGTAGRFHKCITMVRPSPARRGWSHEVCRASVTAGESVP